MVEDRKKEIGELDSQIQKKKGYIYEIHRKSEEYSKLNKNMSDALDRLRNIIQHTWTKLEEVEDQIKIKSTTLVELDEKISRKRKRVDEIDQFIDKVLV